MKKSQKASLLSLVTGLFLLSMFALEASAQCVQCLPSHTKGAGLSCQSSGSGGNECQSNGTACVIVGACGGIGGLVAGDSEAAQGIGKIHVDSNTIREIGAKHPRFAIALALLSKSGFIGREGVKVFLLPVELEKGDFERWLAYEQRVSKGAQTANSFGGFARQLREPSKDAPLVIYAVKVEPSADSVTSIVKLEVEEGFPFDPAYSSLELKVIKVSRNNLAQSSWKVENWQLK